MSNAMQSPSVTPATDPQVGKVAIEEEIPPAKPVQPWKFVPTVYFLQALPLFLVTETFATAYKSLKIDNLQIAVWTGLAQLPWVFKMFWGPLVDLSFTKRTWTIAMQMAMTIMFGVSAAAMTSSAFFG